MTDRRRRSTFQRRMAEVLGIRPDEVAERFQGARATTARINRLHPDVPYPELVRELTGRLGDLTPVSWCDDAYFCPVPAGCGPAVPMAERGQVYLQNAASLLPVVALDPQPGERILDVAAAPGGKAFHLAARTGNEGELWLNDAIAPRVEKLRGLAARYGVRYTELTNQPAQYLDKSLPHGSFDRILLDVQCSGEGRIDLRRSDALRHWSEQRIERYRFLQVRMLEAAYRLLRPGGTMVYATCTVSPEENEVPVSQVLRRHADLDVAPVTVDAPQIRPARTAWRDHRIDARLDRAVRVIPDRVFEGFFAAKLTRAAAGSTGPDRG